MPKFTLGLAVIMLYVACVHSYSGLFKSSSKYESRTYSGYARSIEQKQFDKTKASKPQRTGGISAWGIVFIVISLILISVGAYYVAIFYPLLCKKERKYDRIELAAV